MKITIEVLVVPAVYSTSYDSSYW